MTKLILAKMIFSLIRNCYDLVQLMYPKTNHINMYKIGESISITAFAEIENENEELSELFDAYQLDDGTIRLDNEYIREKVSA